MQASEYKNKNKDGDKEESFLKSGKHQSNRTVSTWAVELLNYQTAKLKITIFQSTERTESIRTLQDKESEITKKESINVINEF